MYSDAWCPCTSTRRCGSCCLQPTGCDRSDARMSVPGGTVRRKSDESKFFYAASASGRVGLRRAGGDSMCCCMGIGPLWARSEGSGNVQSSGGSSNDTQREQREVARISRHQQQQRPTQAMTIAATTKTATAAPTRAQWWSHQGSTGRERTTSCGRDDSSGSTTYQYS